MQKQLMKGLAMAKVMTNSAAFFDQLYGYAWYGDTLRAWAAGQALDAGAKVLELGCGPGNLSHTLAGEGSQITGVDSSAKMLKRARRAKSNAVFVEADALALPFEDASFDAVIMASLYNIVPDRAALLDEATRVVRQGGTVSVLFPTPEFTAAKAATLAESQQIAGFSAAAMSLWASVGGKLEAKAVMRAFEDVGFEKLEAGSYLEGCVAHVAGRKI